LQSKSYLKDFHLVGGTALALYYGHRRSIDIDLFTNTSFETSELLEEIQNDYEFQLYQTSINTLKGIIKGVNIDLITHRYPLLNPLLVVEGVRMLSIPDIIAMKLNAISVNGQRSKDFIDIYFSLENYSIEEMLTFYRSKYNQISDMHVLKSLVFFDDVDLSDWPVLSREIDLKWKNVQKKINKEVVNYMKKR